MKFIRTILGALVLWGLCVIPRPAAAIDELSIWSSPASTLVSTTLAYTVTSTYSKNGGTPLLTFLNVTSDKAGSKVQFYSAAGPTVCNFTNSTVTIPVNSTNGFNAAGSQVIVIRHYLTDVYERRVLTTSTGTTNLVVTVAPTTAVIPGDQIWPLTAAGSIPCGVTTTTALNLNGTGIYGGQKGKPLLIEVDCTTNGAINAACASYVP